MVADLEQLGRVVDPAPAHVGDVEEAVDAAEVDERTVLGEVLDDALDDLAFLEALERRLLQRRALLLEEHAARQHDVAALLVELDDLELEVLAEERVEVADRAEVDLRAREERLHAAADRDREATLHARGDDALDQLVALARGADLVPDLEPIGLLLGEDAHAGVVLAGLEEDVDDVARLHADRAVRLAELLERDLALALVADVDDRVVLADCDHGAAEDFALLDAVLAEALGEHRCEVFFACAVLRNHIQADLLHAAELDLTAEQPSTQGRVGTVRDPELSTGRRDPPRSRVSPTAAPVAAAR